MFRRSTSPQPNSSTSHNESNKPFNDWKRRVQQKTRLKLGLTNDLKDSITGNVESRVDRFRSCSTKLTTMKNESEQFCMKLRHFLSLEQTMMSFLPETNIPKIYDEIKNNQLSIVIDYMLTYEIETPINILHHKTEEIEQSITHRNNILLDYQHHVRKLEGLQEKHSNKTDDIKSRQAKVEATSERLKEANQFLEANFRAYEYTFVRLRKRLGNLIYAINFFISQTLANSLLVTSEVTPEINSILEQMNTLQISQQERRVVSVNASHEAAQIFNPSTIASSSSSSSHNSQSYNNNQNNQNTNPLVRHSISTVPSSLLPKYIRSTSSLLQSRTTESTWNDHNSLHANPASSTISMNHSEINYSFDEVDHHNNNHNNNATDSHHKYELEDYVYSLNLHMGVLGEIFGRSFEELPSQYTTSLNLTHISNTIKIPSVILDCLIYLVYHSLQVEGIFRISGDEDLIADLRRSYDEGESHNEFRIPPNSNQLQSQNNQSYNLSSLIKLYFRLLPETLFPKKIYSVLLSTLQQYQNNTDEYVKHMKDIFTLSETNSNSLTNLNIMIISYLFYLLNLITTDNNSSINKMTKDNISIIFAPTLLCSEGNSELNLYELQNGIQIIKKILEHSTEIFGEIWERYPLEKVGKN